jgi:hypothetical protein
MAQFHDMPSQKEDRRPKQVVILLDNSYIHHVQVIFQSQPGAVLL